MTDTINTYADPGSDPPHEWKQPAFTPDEYRTAAKVLRSEDARGWLGSHTAFSAVWCDKQAARLEAESARDEEAERLAQVQYEGEIAYAALEGKRFGPWEESTDFQRAVTLAGVRAVLDRLAAGGRLLPEGGTLLTYDEGTLHRVYAALGNAGLSHRVAEDAVNEMQNLGILFREREDTPPAVSVPDSGPDGTSEDPCGGTGTVECWNPGGPCTDSVCELCGPCRTCDPNAPILFANSGPDGTPEKPWKTWAAIPDDTPFWSRDHRETNSWWWIKRAGELRQADPYGETIHLGPTDFMDLFAPFVRVDGGKA